MNDLWRALRYLRKYWGTTLGAFLSLLIVTATNLFSPQLLRLVIDQGISAQNLRVILLTSLGLLGVAIVRDSFTFTQSYWSERASQGAAYDMRNAIFTRLENLSFSYHDKAQTGQLMTRVTNDVETVRAFTGNGILQLLNAVVMLIGSATILLITNWKLALVALLMIPAILGVFLFFLTKIGPRFRIVQQKLGNLNTVLQENLAGVRVVKAFVREPYEQERYRNANNSLLQENLAVVRGTSLTFPLIFFISNLGTLAVIWLGGEQVIGGSLSIGELVAFTSYLSFLLLPVFILGSTITSLSQSAASAHRVFEIIDTPIEVKDKPDAVILPPARGSVIFENVSFRYAGSETLSLTDVSFVAEPGQTVAILGRTGSGKSTIAASLYDRGGSLVSDDIDMRHFTFGLPLLAALILAARAPHRLRNLLIGYAVLLPFQTWGVVAEFLEDIAGGFGPGVASQTGFSAWQREAIAFSYQFGALILPTVVPAVVWVLMHRRLLEAFARGRAA